jgi:hypothetical protein
MQLPTYNIQIILSDPDDPETQIKATMERVPRKKVISTPLPMAETLAMLERYNKLLRTESGLEESLRCLATARNAAVEAGLETVSPEHIAMSITDLDKLLQRTRREVKVVSDDLEARPLLQYKFA